MPGAADEEAKRIKLVVVGDGTVGKTCLLVTFTENRFPEGYEPTVYETWQKDWAVDGTNIKLDLWDTAGQETYDRIRPLSYPYTDVFLLCFDVTLPVSFCNVKDKWVPELREHRSDAPIILVGTKSDLRHAPQGSKSVKEGAAKALVKKLGLHKYVECSARTQSNMEQVFEEAVRAVLSPKKKTAQKCVIL